MDVRKNFNRKRVMQIRDQIQAVPGAKPATIAKRIGVRKDCIYRYLPFVANIYEDEKGRLYPCL